jgi:tetratricopeptide (TPR) repeat protein
MSLCGTPFLYRLAKDSNKPGYSTIKYWWTTGCFPTGRETPVRVAEFEAEYLRAHVPEEVEEWLRFFVSDPVYNLAPAMDKLRMALESTPDNAAIPEAVRALVKPQPPSVGRLVPHMKRIGDILGVDVPAVCMRGVVANSQLRTQVLDDTFEYAEAVRAGGSTPHRRTMRLMLEEEDRDEPLHLPKWGGGSEGAMVPSDAAKGALGALLDVPKETAPDEMALVRMLTTFAEGGAQMGNFEAAEKPLQSALMFSNCRDSRSSLHGNLASSYNLQGRFEEAEENARESLMLKPSKRAFSNLSVALAYQERSDEALAAADDALSVYPEDLSLAQLRGDIKAHVVNRPARSVDPNCSVYHTIKGRQQVPGQLTRGLRDSDGVMFGHEFDAVKSSVHKKGDVTNVHFQLNPTSKGLGMVVRRSGSQGSPFTRTNSSAMEGF